MARPRTGTPIARATITSRSLVIAAGGFSDTAVWGGLLTQAALARGLAGVVVDGAVRDAAEIREHLARAYRPGE